MLHYNNDTFVAEQKQLHNTWSKCLHSLWFRCMVKNSAEQFYIKSCLFSASNMAKISDKVSMCILNMDYNLMEQVHGALVMILLENL